MFSFLILVGETIRLEHVEVPSVVAVGETAAFLCNVDLEFDNELYSVKWYKDSEEFYEVCKLIALLFFFFFFYEDTSFSQKHLPAPKDKGRLNANSSYGEHDL